MSAGLKVPAKPQGRPRGSRSISRDTLVKTAIGQAFLILFPQMRATSASRFACAIYDSDSSKNGHKSWSQRREFIISETGFSFAPVPAWRAGDADENVNPFESEERHIRNRLMGSNGCVDMSFAEFQEFAFWGEGVMMILGSKTGFIAKVFAAEMTDRGFPRHASERLLAIARLLHARGVEDDSEYDRLPKIDVRSLRRDATQFHPITPAVSALREILQQIAEGRDPFDDVAS